MQQGFSVDLCNAADIHFNFLPPHDTQSSYKHVCLLVDDMSSTLRDLADQGLDINESPTQGLNNNLQYWLTDPDGNPIELMQIMPTSPHASSDASFQSRSRAK